MFLQSTDHLLLLYFIFIFYLFIVYYLTVATLFDVAMTLCISFTSVLPVPRTTVHNSW